MALLSDNTVVVILEKAQQYSTNFRLDVPIREAKLCRILGNAQILIETNFLKTSYIMDSTDPTLSIYEINRQVGITGTPDLYWEVANRNIETMSISMLSSGVQQDINQPNAYEIVFEFFNQ